MARVTRPPQPTINRTTGTAGTSGTAATTATTATDAATDASPTDAMGGPAATGAASGVPKAEINGLKNLQTKFDDFATSRGSGSFTAAGGNQAGAVDRGYIRCDADPIAGGCRLTVDTFHSAPNDKMTLILMAEVLDTKSNELRTINLSVLGNQLELNGDGFRGKAQFDIKYDDVNKFLKTFNDKLVLSPGKTSLSVMAFWNNDQGAVQHRAGGPARGGRFRIPEAPGTMSPLATRIGTTSAANAEGTPLPLDMQVAYPQALTESFDQLKPDGNIVSRLESEFKGTTDKESMVKAIHAMYGLVGKAEAGKKDEVEKVLGEDWTVSTVNRYWIKDDGENDEVGKKGTGQFAGFRVDDDGLPVQDPMRDQYMDNKRLGMTAHEGAIRVRSNKQGTMINVKPGGGRLDDKTGIKQRIEVGLELKPDADVDSASEFLRSVSSSSQWSDTIFNHAQKEVKNLDPNLKLAECLEPWLEVVQDRHKFTVKNEKTGVEIEFSFDIVTSTTLRPEHADENGDPRTVKYYVLEGELDHLQLAGSQNQGNYAAGDADGGAFETDDKQEKWLSGTSAEVTMDIDPRLHELEDLKNDKFRQTNSYKSFETVNDRLNAEIFPNGFKPAKQKAAYAAELLGLVPLTREAVSNKVRHAVESAGLKWTPELKGALEKMADSDARMTKVDDLYYDPTSGSNVVNMLERIYGIQLPPLEYNRDNIIMMVEDKIRPLGLEVSSELSDMLGKLTVDKVSPEWLKQQLEGLDYADDGKVFTDIAARQGVPTAKPTVNVQGLKGRVEDAFKQAWVDESVVPAMLDFLQKAADGGASAYKIRQQLGNMSWQPKQAFEAFKTDTTDAPPKLVIDQARFLKSANDGLKAQHVKVDDALKDFLIKASTDGFDEVSTARDFAQELSYGDFGKKFTDMATKLGVPAPKLTYDMKALDKALEMAVGGAMIKFDSGLEKFAHQLLDAGVSSYTLKETFSNLSRRTLPEALKSSGVTVPDGVTVPSTSWDLAKVDENLKQSCEGVFVFFNRDMKSFTHKLLKEDGMTPSKLSSAISGLSRRKLPDALKSAGVKVPDGLTIPEVNFDEGRLIDHLKSRAGSGWNDEVETYLKANLDDALKTDGFKIDDVTYASLSSVLKKVETATSVAPPAVG